MKTYAIAVLVLLGCLAGGTVQGTPTPSEGNNPCLQLALGDPIGGSSGGFYFSMPLFDLGGPLPLRYGISYRTLQATGGAFGFAEFDHDVPLVAVTSATVVDVYSFNGGVLGFAFSDGAWKAGDGMGVVYQLQESGPDSDNGYFYLMDPNEERVYIFEKIAGWGERLRWVVDRNGNTLIYTYPAAAFRYPTRIEDGLGRSLDLTYPSGRIGTVTDQGGRQIAMTYDQGYLDTVTDPVGAVTAFTYDANWAVTAKTMPAGNVPYTQTYAERELDGTTTLRVTSQTDAYANTMSLAFDAAANRVTETRADLTAVTYEHHAEDDAPRSLTDATGETGTVTKTSRSQISGFTDREGDTTTLTYHPETGKLASVTDPLGGVTTYTYTAQGQTFTNPATAEQVSFTFYELARVDRADGSHEEYTYDAAGNMLTEVDRAGETRTFTYNGRGQVLTETNAAGGVATSTYDADGTLATTTDSDLGTTTYAYDGFKRLTTVTHPGAVTTLLAYDLADRLTSVTDENGNATAFTYDANGNLTRVTDPAAETTDYTYDLMDRLTQVTDRRGKTSTDDYDSMERLVSTTDPNALETTYTYDPRGWRTGTTLGGVTWQTGYDDEGVASSSTTPLGHLSQQQTDALGQVVGLTDPLAATTALTRDAMSRITVIIDPLLRTIDFGYEARGLLSGVTVPAAGATSYSYDSLGGLLRVTDFNGSQWDFAYTAMGRRRSQTDPLGNPLQWTYDSRGRPDLYTHADGATETVTYDPAGNVTRRLHSDATDLVYTYDTLDRLTGTGGIDLTLDEEGQVTATVEAGMTYDATWDDGGRLATATYAGGALTVTYEYDAVTGLLSRISDNLTATVIDFTYDADRRLVGVARPNGVDTTLTWDDAGRLTRIQDGAVSDLIYTLDDAGQVIQAEMTLPLDPADLLADSAATYTHDAASQVSSAGYVYDPRGRLTASPDHALTWNDASQLVDADGAILTYDGLGNLLTRATGGSTVRYFYNAAVALTPIVAERDDNAGTDLRYYVWTPAGDLVYMIDAGAGNAVYHYHFDRVGSTVALTDAAGALSDSYAYSPYGRLLAHVGSNAQPFTYVGRWGVRQEGDSGDLYQMRARYYEAATARFVSREPLWPHLAEPRDLNPYQYARRDPMATVDPTGLTSQHSETQVQRNSAYGEASVQPLLLQFFVLESQREVNRLESQIAPLDMVLFWTNYRIEQAENILFRTERFRSRRGPYDTGLGTPTKLSIEATSLGIDTSRVDSVFATLQDWHQLRARVRRTAVQLRERERSKKTKINRQLQRLRNELEARRTVLQQQRRQLRDQRLAERQARARQFHRKFWATFIRAMIARSCE